MAEDRPSTQEKHIQGHERLPVQPDVRFLFQHPAHIFALGFGSGLSPVAPGTAGTLFAWAVFILLNLFLSKPVLALTIVLSFPLGLWACKVTAENMCTKDPGAIVWDEVVAFWVVLFFIPTSTNTAMTFTMQLIAFGLFRLFDAVKRGPVGWADKKFTGEGCQGAFGIMFDDIVAALLTLVCIFMVHFISALF